MLGNDDNNKTEKDSEDDESQWKDETNENNTENVFNIVDESRGVAFGEGDDMFSTQQDYDDKLNRMCNENEDLRKKCDI